MTNFRKLPEPFKTNWIKALRSGIYKQGRSYLYRLDDKYCCLGVACVVVGIELERLKERSVIPEGFSEVPKTLIGDCSNVVVNKLTMMNDGFYETGEGSYSFLQIADWIEENL